MAKRISIGPSTVISEISGHKQAMVKGKGWTPVKKVKWRDKVLIRKKSFPNGVMMPPKITHQWVEASYQITENI